MSHHIVIAIDFGTSYSGYAYAFVDDGRVIGTTKWPGQDVPYVKTPTLLLYNPEGKLEAWGFPANRRLAELRRGDGAMRYRLYRNFKMDLHAGRPAGAAGPMVQTGGVAVPAVTLIADYLRALKDHALEEIRASTTATIADRDILWCLTVPAIWTDTDKQRMRAAAQKAGLIGTGRNEAQRLVMVLEPEAAALRCLTTEQKVSFSEFDPGTRFMVIDVGGGTVDITAHELLANGSLKEITQGTGGPFGSTCVDKAFKGWLERRLTADALAYLIREEPTEFLVWMDDWERLKCSFQLGSQAALLSIRTRLHRVLDRNFPKVLEALATNQDGDDTALVIDRTIMEGLFESSLTGILREVETQLTRLGAAGVDVVFLVGGFSASPILRARLNERFASRFRKLILPAAPGACVVEGAVLYGLRPSVIRVRRSRLTYGCGYEPVFEEGVDPQERRYYNEDWNEFRCRGRFLPFVRSGDSIDVDATVIQELWPIGKNQTRMVVSFFATGSTTARLIDEPNMRLIGTLQCDMPDTTRGLQRKVRITLRFGGTEITASAMDVTSGEQVASVLEFTASDFTYFDDQVGA